MADSKKNSSGSNDVAFRRTWDREEYAKKGAEREAKEKAEAKARWEAKQAGKKYIRRASTPPDVRETQARAQRLDVSHMVGKTTLVPAGAAVGKRGHGAGFYCADCDLTYKDSKQLLEHYNSKQHLMKIGETGEVRSAGVEEVRERLKYLKRKLEEENSETVANLGERIAVAKEKEETLREEKRQKRREKRRKTKDGVGVHQPVFEDDGVLR
jgi:U4/U6.U5 tri-snRNP component SNU23